MSDEMWCNLEQIITRDMGRGIGRVCAASAGSLRRATAALHAQCRRGGHALVATGFFIPHQDMDGGGAAETDGPLGAALLYVPAWICASVLIAYRPQHNGPGAVRHARDLDDGRCE